MLPAPVRFSLLFNGRIGHFGLLFQTPFLQVAVIQVAVALAEAEPLLLLLLLPSPGRRKRLPPFALRAMPLALRLFVFRFLGDLSKTVSCSLQSFVTCGRGTVLNHPPLVYDLLLRWHIQGNCLCIQTVQSQLGATALVALVEIQVPTEAKELLRVVASQAL